MLKSVSILDISTIIILLLAFIEIPKSTNNYNLLMFIIVVFSIFFVWTSLKYIKISQNTKSNLSSKWFYYSQIYNIISFVLGIIFYDYIRFDVRAFSQLYVIDKILNILFFPGSYFSHYFECVELGWTCFGSTFGITVIFNVIIFITIGFILGIILNRTMNKK